MGTGQGAGGCTRLCDLHVGGSTGRPKGVEITHRDVVTLMDTAATDFEFLASDVWTMFHSYAFDFSVWEMWGGPLLTGARLLIVDRELARDPRAFVDLLAAERVTVLSQTPSAFYQLIDARREADRDLALRYVVFGGEALSFDQVRRWFDEDPSDSARLVNMYGITETTVHVSFRALDRDLVAGTDASLIGRPLASLGGFTSSMTGCIRCLRVCRGGDVCDRWAAGRRLLEASGGVVGDPVRG